LFLLLCPANAGFFIPGTGMGNLGGYKAGDSRFTAERIKDGQTQRAVRIFMSSSTDPYQPVEYKEKVTRFGNTFSN
jgi:hypothetical protein